MRLRRPLAAVALLTSVALVTAACGGDGEAADETSPDDTGAPADASPPEDGEAAADFPAGSTMAELAEAGTVTIGTKFDQPGFGLQGLDGTPEGFDVEIAKIIAAELGIGEDGIEWLATPSAIREEVIETGQADVVVATYTINDERRERISFAGPYYEAGQDIMVAAGDDRITGPESFTEDDSLRVCSVTGSTSVENIREFLADPDGQLSEFPEYSDCADALRTGQTDAVTTDNVILLGFVDESPEDFQLVGNAFTQEPYGIGFEQGDVEFCEFVHETLLAAQESGAYQEAWESTAGAIPGAETPELPEFEEGMGAPRGGGGIGLSRLSTTAEQSSRPGS